MYWRQGILLEEEVVDVHAVVIGVVVLVEVVEVVAGIVVVDGFGVIVVVILGPFFDET